MGLLFLIYCSGFGIEILVLECEILVLEFEIVVFEFRILVLEYEMLVPDCTERQNHDLLNAVFFVSRWVLAAYLGYSFLLRRH